jgi:hypothetical protein
MAEVCPVHLRPLAGKRMELKKRLAIPRAQSRDGTSQLHHASAVTAVANRLVEARGAQCGMSFQGLTEEREVGIDERRSQRLRAAKAFGLDGVANGIGPLALGKSRPVEFG